MSAVDLIRKFIQEVPLNEVYKARLEFAKEQAAALEKKLAECQERHQALSKKYDDLVKQHYEMAKDLEEAVAEMEAASRAKPKEEFVEHRGALFKKRPHDGRFHEAVYCPNCKRSASRFENISYDCTACGWFASFKPSELPEILRELESDI